MNLKLHFLTGVSLLLLALGSTPVGIVTAHEESGEWHCDSDEESRIVAEFRPGLVTLDGLADDWADIDGFEFPLLPALDPDNDHQFGGGKMTVKALHDGKDVYFMLQVDGDYAYTKGDDYKCPSVALMYQVGESATYHNMGGCKESPDSCNNKSCRGYEVDIMHFSIGNAIPGRLYGGNPIDNRDGNGDDRFGHLVDLYAWNPHCLNLDGVSRTGIAFHYITPSPRKRSLSPRIKIWKLLLHTVIAFPSDFFRRFCKNFSIWSSWWGFYLCSRPGLTLFFIWDT